MKVLDRYIVRLNALTLVATFMIMAGLYLLLHFFSHVQDLAEAERAFAERGLGLWTGVSRYYMVHLPEILVMFGPYAILLAGIYSLHQLNQNNELTPMYAMGVSKRRVTLPIFILALLVSLALSAVREQLIPSLAREMVTLQRLMKGKEDAAFKDLPLLADSHGNLFVCESWDTEQRRLNAVWMQLKAAPEPVFFPSLTWNESSNLWDVPADSAMGGPQELGAIDLVPADIELIQRSRNRQSFSELVELTERKPGRRDLVVLKHLHLTYPLTGIVLLLLGLPLVLTRRHRSVYGGLFLCFVLALAYFSTSLILQRLGGQGDFVPPVLGAWLPIVCFGSIGLLLFELTGQN